MSGTTAFTTVHLGEPLPSVVDLSASEHCQTPDLVELRGGPASILGTLDQHEAWATEWLLRCTQIRQERNHRDQLVLATPETVAHLLLGVDDLDRDAGLGPEAA